MRGARRARRPLRGHTAAWTARSRRKATCMRAGGRVAPGRQQLARESRCEEHEVFFFFAPTPFSACSSQSSPPKSHSSETGGKLRARRPAGVEQHVAVGRRAGIRGLGRNREHLPPPARVRGRDRAALRRGAGESPATGKLLQESLRLLSPSAANFCSEHDEAATPRSVASRKARPGSAAVTPEGAHKRDVNRDLDSSEGGPFATTSNRRPSETGTPRFKSRRATLVATRAPTS